jgi:hypothetical protein
VDPYRAWLAQMPREFVRKRMDDIKQQLEDLPRELEFLQKLDALPLPAADQSRASVSHETPAREMATPAVTAETGSNAERPRRRRKMSQERRAIRDAVGRLRPNAGPAEVAEATGQELSAVQKTMSRMARDGQLLRMGYRRYDLPPNDAESTLLGEPSSNTAEGAITL